MIDLLNSLFFPKMLLDYITQSYCVILLGKHLTLESCLCLAAQLFNGCTYQVQQLLFLQTCGMWLVECMDVPYNMQPALLPTITITRLSHVQSTHSRLPWFGRTAGPWPRCQLEKWIKLLNSHKTKTATTHTRNEKTHNLSYTAANGGFL